MYEERHSTSYWLKAGVFLGVFVLVMVYFGINSFKSEATRFNQYNRYLETLPTSSKTIFEFLANRGVSEEDQAVMIDKLIAFSKSPDRNSFLEQSQSATEKFTRDPFNLAMKTSSWDGGKARDLLAQYYLKPLDEIIKSELNGVKENLPTPSKSVADSETFRLLDMMTTPTTNTPTPTPTPSYTPPPGVTVTPPPGSTPTPGKTKTPGKTPSPSPGKTKTPTPGVTETPLPPDSTELPAVISRILGLDFLKNKYGVWTLGLKDNKPEYLPPYARYAINSKGDILAYGFLFWGLYDPFLLPSSVGVGQKGMATYGAALMPTDLIPIISIPAKKGAIIFYFDKEGEPSAQLWPGPKN